MKNILSIDLESWIHLHDDALRTQRSVSSSSELKSADNNYIADATAYILDLLDTYNQTATFFIIGKLYEWYPDVIEGIEKRGHEIGYHTHTHRLIYNKEILNEDLKKSGDFLNRFKPTGFRAPQIFITRDSYSCLKNYGFKYSSSTYSEYEIMEIDGIDEIPVSCFRFRGGKDDNQKLPKNLTLKLLSRQIPIGSGFFIALFGPRISHFIDSLNRRNIPAILFFHPWQLCTHKDISGLSFKLKTLYRNPLCFPYTLNIKKTLDILLSRYSFLSFREYYKQKDY